MLWAEFLRERVGKGEVYDLGDGVLIDAAAFEAAVADYARTPGRRVTASYRTKRGLVVLLEDTTVPHVARLGVSVGGAAGSDMT